MSKMAELDMEIRDMLDEGFSPVSVSVRLNIPLTFVYDVLDSVQEDEDLSPFNTVNS
jgi:hypothetical protein